MSELEVKKGSNQNTKYGFSNHIWCFMGMVSEKGGTPESDRFKPVLDSEAPDS